MADDPIVYLPSGVHAEDVFWGSDRENAIEVAKSYAAMLVSDFGQWDAEEDGS
jgi:hypothetical protein